ncbi:hypothetical protein CYMTET_48109, partial [Cymbomonas tetramitiformis]
MERPKMVAFKDIDEESSKASESASDREDSPTSPSRQYTLLSSARNKKKEGSSPEKSPKLGLRAKKLWSQVPELMESKLTRESDTPWGLRKALIARKFTDLMKNLKAKNSPTTSKVNLQDESLEYTARQICREIGQMPVSRRSVEHLKQLSDSIPLVSTFFEQLDSKSCKELAKYLVFEKLGTEAVICKQGEKGEWFYIILSGKCFVYVQSTESEEREEMKEVEDNDEAEASKQGLEAAQSKRPKKSNKFNNFQKLWQKVMPEGFHEARDLQGRDRARGEEAAGAMWSSGTRRDMDTVLKQRQRNHRSKSILQSEVVMSMPISKQGLAIPENDEVDPASLSGLMRARQPTMTTLAKSQDLASRRMQGREPAASGQVMIRAITAFYANKRNNHKYNSQQISHQKMESPRKGDHSAISKLRRALSGRAITGKITAGGQHKSLVPRRQNTGALLTADDDPLTTEYGKKVAELEAGACFGEIALLSEVPRQASIVTKDNVELLKVNRTKFLATMQSVGSGAGTMFHPDYIWSVLDTPPKNRSRVEELKMHIFVTGMPFFKKLPPKVMIELISALKGSKIRAGEVVFNQGDQGDAMFIIVSVSLQLHLQMEAEDKEKEKEKTVQQRQPRMSKQETETRSRSTTLGGDPQEVRRTLRGAASRRDPSQLTAVEAAERLEALKLKVATEYPQGDPPPADQLEAFYTRLESAASQIYGKCVNRLQRGTSFGELALIKRSPRAATILAIDECILIKIEKGAYDRTLRVVQQREMEEKIAFLRTIPALQLMRRGELQRFVHYIKVKTMPRNEVVVQQGELGTALYLIYEGEVRVLRKTANPVRAHSLQVLEPGAKPCMQKLELATMGSGQYFGEDALFGRPKRTPNDGIGESTSEMVENERGGHAYTIICNTATTLYIISKENLLNQTASHILQAFRDAQKVKLNFRVQRTEFLKESQVTSPAPEVPGRSFVTPPAPRL